MLCKRRKQSVDIFPLSCNPELSKEQLEGLSVYHASLDEALSNPRIRNVAITGPRGIGKSSIVRSYAKKKRRKYLYITLGHYIKDSSEDESCDESGSANGASPSETAVVAERPTSVADSSHITKIMLVSENSEDQSQQEEQAKKNAIEHRLLLQIISRFNRNQLCASKFKLTPEHPRWYRVIWMALFVLSIVTVCFQDHLKEIFLSALPEFAPCSSRVWSALEVGMKVYIFAFGFLMIVCILHWLAIKLTSQNFSIKAGDAEMEEKADYLDQYMQELVYVLTQINKKIGYTVVFEDMDRLPTELCLPIFSRLREINHIVNSRMRSKNDYIRFVFVIDEKISLKLESSKFFDYVLPVVSAFNKETSETIFKKKLTEVNEKLLKEYTESSPVAIDVDAEKDIWKAIGDEILQVTAPYMPDYRMHNIILNEFALRARVRFSGAACTSLRAFKKAKEALEEAKSVLKEAKNALKEVENALKKVKRTLKKAKTTPNEVGDAVDRADAAIKGITNAPKEARNAVERAKNAVQEAMSVPKGVKHDLDHIFALVVYKHLLPEDFDRMSKGETCIFTGRNVEDAPDESRKELYAALQKCNALDWCCYFYGGFSEDTVYALLKEHMESTTAEKRIQFIREACKPERLNLLAKLCRDCAVRQNQVTPEWCNGPDILAEMIVGAVQLHGKSNYCGHSWFFNGRNFSRCISVLLCLALDASNNSICQVFIEQCKGSETQYDLFADCSYSATHDKFSRDHQECIRELYGRCVNRPNAPTRQLSYDDSGVLTLK